MALVFCQLLQAVGVIELNLVLFSLEEDGCAYENVSVGGIDVHVIELIGGTSDILCSEGSK